MENLDEQVFIEAIAALPTNLHSSIINAANHSVIDATDKVFSQVDVLPLIIRAPLNLLTLNGAKKWIHENSASEVFVRNKFTVSEYINRLFGNMHIHYFNPLEKASGQQWLNPYQG